MAIGKGLQSLIPKKPAATRQQLHSFGREAGGPAIIPSKADLGGKKDETGQVFYIETYKIKSNPHQPRKGFNRAKLEELAASIKEHGILQPLVVTQQGDKYQLIAGERRLESAKICGLQKVPVIVRDSSEKEKLELALVENLQRDNLNPIEKAFAFKKLIKDFNFIQQDIAKRIGKSRETVANALRLLDLPAEIQRAILEEKISEGHGRVILVLPDTEKQLLLFREIIKNGLSVRQAENLAKNISPDISRKPGSRSRKDPFLKDLENRLSDVLGTRVIITRKGKKGKITIEFFSQEEMENILDRILKK